MITGGLSCDRVEFGDFGGGSDDPPDPPLATGLKSVTVLRIEQHDVILC